MNFFFLKNNKGLTLTELVIGLGVSSILMLVVISGSAFVQQYINRWNGSSKLLEELSFVQSEIKEAIETSEQIDLSTDSLICISNDRIKHSYTWKGGEFLKDQKSMLRKGVKLESFTLSRIALQKSDTGYILMPVLNGEATGLYKLSVAVSEREEKSDTLTLFLENSHEQLKFKQK